MVELEINKKILLEEKNKGVLFVYMSEKGKV